MLLVCFKLNLNGLRFVDCHQKCHLLGLIVKPTNKQTNNVSLRFEALLPVSASCSPCLSFSNKTARSSAALVETHVRRDPEGGGGNATSFRRRKKKHHLTWRQLLLKKYESKKSSLRDKVSARPRCHVSLKWGKLLDRRPRGRHAHRAQTELNSESRGRCQYTPPASPPACLPRGKKTTAHGNDVKL